MKAELKKLIDDVARQPELSSADADNLMLEAFKLADSAEERMEAGQYLTHAISNRKRPDVEVRSILGEAANALNLSYIAKRYFKKDRTWLYQRLNHSIVNGKPASFSQAELQTLSNSLAELSIMLNQISVKLTH